MRRDSRKNSKWKMALAPLGAATLLALSVCTAYTRADAASAATSIPEESTAEEDKDNSGSSADNEESSEQQGSGAGEEETEQQTQGSDAASGSAQSAQDDGSASTDAEQTSEDDKASSAKETDASTEAATEETVAGTTDVAAVEASTEPEEAADAEDTDDEDLNDAMTLTCSLDDGTEITADIPEGAFPAGVEMKAEREDSASYEAAIEDAAADNEEASSDDSTITQYAAFDITFYLPADPDTELEPEKPISLTFSNVDVDSFDQEKDADKEQSSSDEDRDSSSDKNGSDTDDQAVSDSTRLTVWHVEDDGTDAQQVETDTYSILDNKLSASVQADQFSTYVLRLTAQTTQAQTDVTEGAKIKHDSDGNTQVYSVQDENGNTIYLYCMNDGLDWPDVDEGYSSETNYLNSLVEAGTLTSDQRDELMKKLKIVLYAGYPYNGFGLFNIVSSTDAVTADDLDNMLTVTDDLRKDFSSVLGDTKFSYNDYLTPDSENMKKLKRFVSTVITEAQLDQYTSSGISYKQIEESSFFNAAYALVLAAKEGKTPVEIFNNNDFFAVYHDFEMTGTEAYHQTNAAIWYLMKKYGVPFNDGRYSGLDSYPLAKKLVDLAESDTEIDVPDSEPSEGFTLSGVNDNVKANQCTYDDGKWYSDYLTIHAPQGWNVLYKINGAVTDEGLDVVSAGTPFRLVFDSKPNNTTVTFTAVVPWFQKIQQYMPISDEQVTDSDTEHNKHQNMIGAAIQRKTFTAQAVFTYDEDSSDSSSSSGSSESTDSSSASSSATSTDSSSESGSSNSTDESSASNSSDSSATSGSSDSTSGSSETTAHHHHHSGSGSSDSAETGSVSQTTSVAAAASTSQTTAQSSDQTDASAAQSDSSVQTAAANNTQNAADTSKSQSADDQDAMNANRAYVKTGDSSNTLLWLVVCGASAVLLLFYGLRARRHNR